MYNQSLICHCSNCKQHGTLKCFQKHVQAQPASRLVSNHWNRTATQPNPMNNPPHNTKTRPTEEAVYQWAGLENQPKLLETVSEQAYISVSFQYLYAYPNPCCIYAHQPQQHDLLISFWNLMLLFSLTWLASHQSSVSLIPDYENAPVKWFSSSPWLNRYTQLTFLIFSCLDGYLFMV